MFTQRQKTDALSFNFSTQQGFRLSRIVFGQLNSKQNDILKNNSSLASREHLSADRYLALPVLQFLALVLSYF